MCANPQSNWLNTMAVNESFIHFTYFEAISLIVYLPPEKTKTETNLSF